jgi:hypothetical protein
MEEGGRVGTVRTVGRGREVIVRRGEASGGGGLAKRVLEKQVSERVSERVSE